MKGFKVKKKLKKSLIVTIVTIMIAFMTPVRAKADILNDFVDLILHIPDGLMFIIDHAIGGSEEFTYYELDLHGTDDGGRGNIYNFIVTPYEIFSSGSYEETPTEYKTNIGWLDINFFADKPVVSDSTAVSSEILAPVIGNIYKSLRNLAMVLMLLVILYIGIKIMISSIAAQQAKYKQFLVDWLVGFALLFMMHYIMSGIIYLNSAVVKMLDNDEGDSYYLGISELKYTFGSTASRWLKVTKGNAELKGAKYENFKTNRLSVEGTNDTNATYSVTRSGPDTGYLNMNGYSNRRYDDQAVDLSKWGDNGEIYLSATIYNSGEDDYRNKAILKLNAMSYVRTISSFASGSEWFTGNKKVHFYDNGTMIEVDKSTTMGYSALYLCLVIETIMFLFTYIKRVLQMAFLTMVAPIVAIMYPVDKLGDGKAQAFNTWFKDYLFNVLIQPMHLLLYTIFIVAASELVSKNIIYGLAIYGFMIPSEKYFKKILGFEKAAGGAPPGPLSGALGRGLAMDGLGRLAGIGPGGHGKGGPGGNGGGRKPKLKKKNKPGDTAPRSSGGPSSGGDGPLSGGVPSTSGATGGATTGTTRGSRRGGSSRGTRPSTGGVPSAGGGNKFGKALWNTGKRRFARAVTGGQYDYMTGNNGAWKAAGKYIGRGAGRMITRGAGVLLGGAVGVTAGVATAMATGDVNNIFKGATVGAGAGNKMSSNIYDRSADFIEGFGDELKSERAKIDPEVNRDVRVEDTFRRMDEDLADLSEADNVKYSKEIEEMAEFVNFDDLKDVKSMSAGRAAVDGEPALGNSQADQEEAIAVYNDAHGYSVVGHEKSYMEDALRDIVDNRGVAGVNESNIKAAAKDYTENGTVAPTGNADFDSAIRAAITRMKRVKAAQKELGK